MTRTVLTAVGGAWEADLVTALEGTAGYAVARRCADLADLVAAAAAGVGEVALVSPELRALDRPALHELATHGVHVAGVTAPRDICMRRIHAPLSMCLFLFIVLAIPQSLYAQVDGQGIPDGV